MVTLEATSALLALLVLVGASPAFAQSSVAAGVERDAIGGAVACRALSGRSFEGNTTITAADAVTSGSLVVSPTITLNNLPPFCRVQGVSKPSADSNIFFEVWLPAAGSWNGKFLSTGEGGFAGTPNYTRNGLYHKVEVDMTPPRGLPKLKWYWRRGYYAPTE